MGIKEWVNYYLNYKIFYLKSGCWFFRWDYWYFEWKTPRLNGNNYYSLGPLRIVLRRTR